MPDKYLSIITNFGCHFTCPYCIVKNNNINVPVTTLEGLDRLKEMMKATGANIISVSGGGDPLYDFKQHKGWWNKLFDLCLEMDLPVEVHTSYLSVFGFPYEKVHRMVYHLRNVRQLDDVRKYYSEKVRVVFVVDETFDLWKIARIDHRVHDDLSDIIDELSFRQMVDKNYKTRYYYHDLLKFYHKDRWWYIEQGDYNTYYVNGKLYTKFSDIGKEKE